MKTNLISLMARKQGKTGRFITQTVVADETGLSPATLSRWIHNDLNRIDLDTLYKLADYFECSPLDILQFEKEKA